MYLSAFLQLAASMISAAYVERRDLDCKDSCSARVRYNDEASLALIYDIRCLIDIRETLKL
jgi:hypothetical protein